MLLCPLYHRINADAYSNDAQIMTGHLHYIREHFHVVLPGDILSSDRINCCLTFDDGFYEVYHFVYPLLKELGLRALLAIPAAFPADESTLPDLKRLGIAHHDIEFDEIRKELHPYCTFQELGEMVASGHIQIASHGMSHVNLTSPDTNLNTEIIESKRRLEEKLGVTINSFVFPFGRYHDASIALAREHYRYLFRIGNASNHNFDGINGLIYRINADSLQSPNEPFTRQKLLGYGLKALLKKIAA